MVNPCFKTGHWRSPVKVKSLIFLDAIQELHRIALLLLLCCGYVQVKGSELRNGNNGKYAVTAGSCPLKSHYPHASCIHYIVTVGLYNNGAENQHRGVNRMGFATSYGMNLVYCTLSYYWRQQIWETSLQFHSNWQSTLALYIVSGSSRIPAIKNWWSVSQVEFRWAYHQFTMSEIERPNWL